MSRFSKAEAEARGWAFVHNREEFDVSTSDTQGESRTIPTTVRAEKYVSLPGQGASLVNIEAESMGLLLERIAKYEAEHDLKDTDHRTQPAPIDDTIVPLNTAGLPQRTVLTGDGAMTEEEWSSRDRSDALITDRDKGTEFITPHSVAEQAEDERVELNRDIENDRARESHLDVERVTIQTDTSDNIDAPGQSAGSVLIVRSGEESTDVGERKQEEAIEHENERVGIVEDFGERVPIAEEDDHLAGVDASLQRRGDLGSETPREEHSEAVEIPQGEVIVPDTESAGEIRADAQEAKAQELGASADEGTHQKEVVEAGPLAEQEVADEAAKEDKADLPTDGEIDGSQGKPSDVDE